MRPRPSRPYVTLAVLCLAVFLVVVDNTIVNVALPTISTRLHASTSALQWVVDGYSLPFAGLLLAGGGLADRFGRRRVMSVGLLGFGAFSAVSAFAGSTGSLIAARALMGGSAAFIFPATLSIATVAFPDPDERARAFGIWSATAGAAIAFGPIVGGVLIAHFWWGSIFLVNVPTVLLVLGLLWRYVPESAAPHRRAPDVGGLILGTGSVTAAVLAIIEGPSWGWTGPTVVSLFAVAALLLVGFIRWELSRREPLLDVRLFKMPAFTSGSIAVSATFFGLFGFIFLVTQYFQEVRGYSPLSAGVHTLPFAITAMIITPMGALLALRLGSRYVVGTGLLIMAGALLWFTQLSAHVAYVGPVMGDMVMLAFGFSLIGAPSTAAIMGALPPEQVGAGAAVNNTTRELGGTLGVAVVGSIFASRFAPAVTRALGGLPIGRATVRAAASSMPVAVHVAHSLPGSLATTVDASVVAAFMSGFHRACSVLGVLMIVFAVICASLLPGRAHAVVTSAPELEPAIAQ